MHWAVSKAEHADAGVRARIDGLCREHKPKKCRVAVYKSGGGDPYTSVLDLLDYNNTFRRASFSTTSGPRTGGPSAGTASTSCSSAYAKFAPASGALTRKLPTFSSSAVTTTTRTARRPAPSTRSRRTSSTTRRRAGLRLSGSWSAYRPRARQWA